MESSLAGSSSGYVKNDVYTANQAQIGNSLVDINLDDFTAFENDSGTVIYVPDSTSEQENSSSCDNEISEETNSLRDTTSENNQEPTPDVYLSSGVYIQPLSFNGNYENIIELIDVDPNEELQESPSQESEDSKTSNGPEAANFEISDGHYDFNFGCQFPISNNFLPCFQNYAELPVNNEIQCLLYSTSVPEYIDINQFIPKEIKTGAPPFLKRNRKPKPVLVANKPESKEREADDNDDDDVIFVNEWLPPKSANSKPKEVLSAETAENSIDVNVEDATLSSFIPAPPVKRRRRRRISGEKRKNPVRKAQINKASLELVEKLAIPSSVFNARVKGGKPKQQINTETKNIRQSCRTTGAIFSPPRPLTHDDFKEWPADGMHERPFYDKAKNTVVKYHIPATTTVKMGKGANKHQVLSELTNVSVNAPMNQQLPNHAKSKDLSLVTDSKKISKRKTAESKQNSNKLAEVALHRVKLMLGYVQEVKKFNKLVAANSSSNQGSLCEKKPSLYEKNLEFRRCQNRKKIKPEKALQKKVECDQESNIQQLVPILHDTCTLYSLTSGVKKKDLVDLVKRFDCDQTKLGDAAQLN